MKKIPYILIILTILLSCKIQKRERNIKPNKLIKENVFYFIRHAEVLKGKNPHLSPKGIERAKKYAAFFSDKKLDSVFSTNLNRTMETANAIAKKAKLKVLFYHPFKTDYDAFLEEHKLNNIVIVGHSNTTPNFVNGIIKQKKYTQIEHENYANIYKIVLLGGKLISNEIIKLD